MPLDVINTDAIRVESSYLATPEAFNEFLLAWHSCRLPAAEFTHAAHVAVAATAIVYLPTGALPLMRSGIRRFNEASGGANTETSGYHESLTRFWVEVVSRVLAPVLASPHRNSFQAACTAVNALGHRSDLHRAYYSFDVIAHREARHIWIPPDLIGPFGPIE